MLSTNTIRPWELTKTPILHGHPPQPSFLYHHHLSDLLLHFYAVFKTHRHVIRCYQFSFILHTHFRISNRRRIFGFFSYTCTVCIPNHLKSCTHIWGILKFPSKFMCPNFCKKVPYCLSKIRGNLQRTLLLWVNISILCTLPILLLPHCNLP